MTSHQWGALAFMAGSALFLVNKLNEMSYHFLARPIPDVVSGDSTAVVVLGSIVFAIGFVAYYRFYAPRAGRVGRVALGMFTGGGILLMLGHAAFLNALWRIGPLARVAERTGFDPFILVVLGGLSMIAGLFVFGAVSLRRPVLARWRWLPLATGLAFVGFALLGGERITPAFLFFRTLFALGLAGLGLGMFLDGAARSTRSPVMPVLVDPEA